MHKKSLLLLCSLGFVLGFTQTAHACFCSYTPVEVVYAGAEVVFVGKVVKINSVKKADVNLVMQESGSRGQKTYRWVQSTIKVRIVTLEVTEAFKGVNKTIDLLSDVYNRGGNCAVNFKRGESYLVYAHQRQILLVDEERKVGQVDLPDEIRSKDEANKDNEKLPRLTTNVCKRTEFLRFVPADVDTVRQLRDRAHNKSISLGRVRRGSRSVQEAVSLLRTINRF